MATSKRKRVLFLAALAANRVGGIESYAAELARQLDPKGWDLTICYQTEARGAVREFLLEPGNVTLDVQKVQEGLGLTNTLEYVKLVLRYRPDVLLYTLGGPVRLWPLLGSLLGVRRSIYYDQTSRSAARYNYRAGSKVQVLMKPLTETICATAFVKACSDREQIVPASKSRVIYSAVDNHRDLGDAAAFREKYAIPADRRIVLQVSWLVPEKGIDVALRAAKRVLDERRDLQFVFCGDGAEREVYAAMAREFGITDHVTWCGQVQDLSASGAWAAAAIQIQCSQWHEAFCLAVAEGMSAGLPVVASRIGGLPELVENGLNGFVFEPKDDGALAAGILKLANDEALRTRMGAAGRERALQNHDLPRNVAAWVDVLVA